MPRKKTKILPTHCSWTQARCSTCITALLKHTQLPCTLSVTTLSKISTIGSISSFPYSIASQPDLGLCHLPTKLTQGGLINDSQIWSTVTNVVSNKSICNIAKIYFDLNSLKHNTFVQVSLTDLENQNLCFANLCCFKGPGSNSHCILLNGSQQFLAFEPSI